MSTKVYTPEDGAIFTQMLWEIAHKTSPEMIFALFHQIADHIEVDEANNRANLIFTKDFQDIKGVKND